MKPEMLEIKLRQCMKPGLPYYLRQIQVITGMQEQVALQTFERYVRDVKSVYWRKIDGKKVYFIEAEDVEPCMFVRLHNWLKENVKWINRR